MPNPPPLAHRQQLPQLCFIVGTQQFLVLQKGTLLALPLLLLGTQLLHNQFLARAQLSRNNCRCHHTTCKHGSSCSHVIYIIIIKLMEACMSSTCLMAGWQCCDHRFPSMTVGLEWQSERRDVVACNSLGCAQMFEACLCQPSQASAWASLYFFVTLTFQHL